MNEYNYLINALVAKYSQFVDAKVFRKELYNLILSAKKADSIYNMSFDEFLRSKYYQKLCLYDKAYSIVNFIKRNNFKLSLKKIPYDCMRNFVDIIEKDQTIKQVSTQHNNFIVYMP